jgi:hypothetical protein
MNQHEPSLDEIEDYNGKESTEKKMTIWIVILSGLLIGAIYGIIQANSSVDDQQKSIQETGITKH